MHRWSRLLVALVMLAGPRFAWPQGGTPLGGEFAINSYTTASQQHGSVASDSAAGFIVVWNGAGQGDATGVFGQRFASSGAPAGPEFRVNTYTTNGQETPSIAADSAGNFVVAWVSTGGYGGSPPDIFGQRFASDGAPLGPEFRVNSYTTSTQTFPDVAAQGGGGFVVVWGGQDLEIFGQRFAGSGAPLGPEFRVNTFTTDLQYFPSVAADAAGNFVVVWVRGQGYAGTPDVLGQRFAADGTPLGTEFRVNTYTTSGQSHPDVAADPGGSFVVVWSGQGQDDVGVFGQRFASSGAPLGPEFRVNTVTTDFQYMPSAAADAAGNFVVAWASAGGYGGAAADVFGQRFASDGTPLGPEFRVNTETSNGQNDHAVAADPAGNFVVTWRSYPQDGDEFGVFGQRFGSIVPVELTRFGVE
jgi:hypothetical protein